MWKLSDLFGDPGSRRGQLIFAGSDFHGYDDSLVSLLHQFDDIAARRPNMHVLQVFLGDYGSKGPRTAQVYDVLTAHRTRADGFEKVFLEGDHDILLRSFLLNANAKSGDTAYFLNHGGIQALESYGVTFRATGRAITHDTLLLSGKNNVITQDDIQRMQAELLIAMPEAHMEFLGSLKDRHETDKYFFCHAGIDPSREWDDQHHYVVTGYQAIHRNDRGVEKDFAAAWGKFDKKIIHGHSIEDPKARRARIGIDGGTYKYGRQYGLIIENDSPRFITADTAYDRYSRRYTGAQLSGTQPR